MKSFSCILLSAALFVASVSAQLTVNTPVNVIECAPLTITWTGGTAPYFLSVHDGNDVNGAPLISFPSTTDASYLWTAVNFTTGTSLDLSLRDSSGLSSQSAVFTIQPGGEPSCLTGGAASGSAAPAGSSASAGASATTPAATPAATTATTPAASGSASAKASGSATSSRPSSTNAAMATGLTYGAAGVLGAAIAAVFV